MAITFRTMTAVMKASQSMLTRSPCWDLFRICRVRRCNLDTDAPSGTSATSPAVQPRQVLFTRQGNNGGKIVSFGKEQTVVIANAVPVLNGDTCDSLGMASAMRSVSRQCRRHPHQVRPEVCSDPAPRCARHHESRGHGGAKTLDTMAPIQRLRLFVKVQLKLVFPFRLNLHLCEASGTKDRLINDPSAGIYEAARYASPAVLPAAGFFSWTRRQLPAEKTSIKPLWCSCGVNTLQLATRRQNY